MKKLFLLLAILLTFTASAAHAQTTFPDVKNPSAIEFEPSADHSLIDSYEMDILRPDDTVLQTINIGKPAIVANLCTADINVQPVSFGRDYKVRLRAIAGTATSDYTISLNKFERAPGPPSKGRVK